MPHGARGQRRTRSRRRPGPTRTARCSRWLTRSLTVPPRCWPATTRTWRRPGLPADAVQLLDASSRDSVKELMRARGLVDVLIPRGGASLIKSVVEDSTVPVIETGVGNCHVYVDAAADLDMALSILLNAKTSRPSVCNAAESLLVHADVAADFLARALPALRDAGVDRKSTRLNSSHSQISYA